MGILTRKGQLAAEGAVSLFVKWSRHTLDVLVDAGRDWEEELDGRAGDVASQWTMTPTEAAWNRSLVAERDAVTGCPPIAPVDIAAAGRWAR